VLRILNGKQKKSETTKRKVIVVKNFVNFVKRIVSVVKSVVKKVKVVVKKVKPVVKKVKKNNWMLRIVHGIQKKGEAPKREARANAIRIRVK
jgi:hypothetical protein